jgi:hypothetical protein
MDLPDTRLDGIERVVPGFVYAPLPNGAPAPATMMRRFGLVMGCLALVIVPGLAVLAAKGAAPIPVPLVMALATAYHVGNVRALDLSEALSRGELDVVERATRSWLLLAHPAARLGSRAIIAMAREQLESALTLVRRTRASWMVRLSRAASFVWLHAEVCTLAWLGDVAGAKEVLGSAGPAPAQGLPLYQHLVTVLTICFCEQDPTIDRETLALAMAAGRCAGVSNGLLAMCAWLCEAQGDRDEARRLLLDEQAKPEPVGLGAVLEAWRSDAIVRLDARAPNERPRVEPSRLSSHRVAYGCSLAVGVAIAIVPLVVG